MRLIDANALIEEIDEEIEYGTEKPFDDADKYITKGLRIARKDILKQPTIDAVPIKHGRWIVKNGYLGNTYYCSECEKAVYLNKFEEPNLTDYCPDCGARMDGDVNE